MPLQDKRNILHIGPPQRPGDPEITPAMADTMRRRIEDAGGNLTVWTVLHDDLYDSPVYSDENDPGDIAMSLRGVALNSVDAQRLAALGPASQFSRWVVKEYRLGLADHLPVVVKPADLKSLTFEGMDRASDEELARLRAIVDSVPIMYFTMNELVAILCEIPPGGAASKLHTGSGRRKDGPLLSLP